MLTKEQIIDHLDSLHEHKMAKDIFVPVLKAMGTKGVKFTGGPGECGIDLEYYELTKPENHKNYVGVQFKKGDLKYSSGGSKNSVKEVKNQADEAFEKEVYDIEGHAPRFIGRFVVAITGIINEPARKYIGRTRLKGADRRVDYWDGSRLAEYIQSYWMSEFVEYFDININEEELGENAIVDLDYIQDNYSALVEHCRKVISILNTTEWEIVKILFELSKQEYGGNVHSANLLMELGNTEEYYREELEHLFRLDFIDADNSHFSLSGQANSLSELYEAIAEEISEAEEDLDNLDSLFWASIK